MTISSYSKRTDRRLLPMLIGLYLFGIGISFHYQSWIFGLGVGTANILMYAVAYYFFAGRLLGRMVTAAAMAIYMLQYLAQMQGLYEMHFWFFIMPIALITFQDWRVYIPFGLLVVIHHSGIFLMSQQGYDQYLKYLVNTDSMSWMVFLYHMGLALLGIILSIAVSVLLRKESQASKTATAQLDAQLGEMNAVAHRVKSLAEVYTANDRMDQGQSAAEALKQLGSDFDQVIGAVISDTDAVLSKVIDEGDLHERIRLEDKKGVWYELSDSINRLLDTFAKPIFNLNMIVNQMAQGNLSVRYEETSKGEIKEFVENLNTSLDRLNDLLLKISEGVNIMQQNAEEMLVAGQEMNTSTGEIAESIGEMSNGAQRQVSSVDQISDIMTRLSQTSRDMESSSEVISSTTKQGLDRSQNGKALLDSMLSSMREVFENANETKKSMAILEGRSGDISRALSVINEIAQQTNLLSLNAAIEAAQAGDAGRGFAVVAEEIRKLAEQSKHSVKEISKVVADVNADMQRATIVINAMNEGVESGVTTSGKASEAFAAIEEASVQAEKLSLEVLSKAKDQSQEIDNALQHIEAVVVVAEETAAGTEEIGASAAQLANGMETFNQRFQRLNEMSSSLKGDIGAFQLLLPVHRTNEEPSPATPAS